MKLTNSLESLLLIIRHLTLNSIQDVTTSNLLGREINEEERTGGEGGEEGVGARGEDEVEVLVENYQHKCTHDRRYFYYGLTLAYSSKMALNCGKLLRAMTW